MMPSGASSCHLSRTPSSIAGATLLKPTSAMFICLFKVKMQLNKSTVPTEKGIIFGTWFGKIPLPCCLHLLPGFAYVIHQIMYHKLLSL